MSHTPILIASLLTCLALPGCNEKPLDGRTVFRLADKNNPDKVRIVGKAYGADNFLVETCSGEQMVVSFSQLNRTYDEC